VGNLIQDSDSRLAVYAAEFDCTYAALGFGEPGSTEFVERFPRRFAGLPASNLWKRWRGTIEKGKGMGDFFYVALGVLGVVDSASKHLEPILKSTGEMLPIELGDGSDAWVWNVTTVSVDAFDNEVGERRLLAGKWRMEPVKWAFRADVIRDLTVFRIPEDPSRYLCVSSAGRERDFVREYQSGGFVGLKLVKLWEEHNSPI
jgi:hypothetical protein